VAERTLPHSLDAEAAVLGAILLDSALAFEHLEELAPADFYHPGHQELANAAWDLNREHQPVDLTTLAARLESTQKMARVGGIDVISELAGKVPTAANVAFYARIVHDASQRRSLIRACRQSISEAYEPEGSADEVVQAAADRVGGCYSSNVGGRSIQAVIRSLDTSEARPLGVPTGLMVWDGEPASGQALLDLHLTFGGLPKGQVTMIGADTSEGKSSLAGCFLANAMLTGHPAVICPFEDRSEAFLLRQIAATAKLSNKDLQGYRVENWDAFNRTIDALYGCSAHFLETIPRSVTELTTKIKRLVKRHAAQVVLIDYLQLLKAGVSKRSRQEEIDYVFEELVDMSLSLPDTAVLIVSQFHRRDKQAQPTLSDFYHSAKIEQGSHTVFLIWSPTFREEYGCKALLIAKQKQGPKGQLIAGWEGRTSSFGAPEPHQARAYWAALQAIKNNPPKGRRD
jgi:replicative DNA helicase